MNFFCGSCFISIVGLWAITLGYLGAVMHFLKSKVFHSNTKEYINLNPFKKSVVMCFVFFFFF